MAAANTTPMSVEPREERGTRAARRTRRSGYIPGVLYGGNSEVVEFKISERDWRQAATSGSNLFDVSVGSGKGEPAVVKAQQRDPVQGQVVHLDLMRVRLDEKIQAPVPVELEGADQAPGVREGGVLEHVTRELTVEALPTDVPEHIGVDVSELDIGDNLTLAEVSAGAGYEILGEPETVIATLSAPRKIEEIEPEIEEEAELVGEEGAEAEGEAPAEGEQAESGEESSEGQSGESK